jgi:hypothetical protein
MRPPSVEEKELLATERAQLSWLPHVPLTGRTARRYARAMVETPDSTRSRYAQGAAFRAMVRA